MKNSRIEVSAGAKHQIVYAMPMFKPAKAQYLKVKDIEKKILIPKQAPPR